MLSGGLSRKPGGPVPLAFGYERFRRFRYLGSGPAAVAARGLATEGRGLDTPLQHCYGGALSLQDGL